LLPALGLAQEKQEAPKPVPAEGTEGGEEDPFGGDSAAGYNRRSIPVARAGQVRAPLRLRLETWEGTSQEVARWLDGTADAAALAKLREDLLNAKIKARLVFNPAVGIDQSTKESSESIAEWIYPTEYEPPGLGSPPPADSAKQSEWQKWLESTAGKFAVPQSFETRNTGQTLEAEVQPVTVQAGHWDVAVSFDSVETPGSLHYGDKDSHIEMPLFQSFRTGGLLRLKEGEWRLLSVMEPPRGIDGKASGQRWITLVRIDPVK
jgi:hypothetical protein